MRLRRSAPGWRNARGIWGNASPSGATPPNRGLTANRLRTEAAVETWAARVKKAIPGVRLEHWRAPFTKEFQYRLADAVAEKKRRIKADLAQAKTLLEKAGTQGIASSSYADLSAALA